MPKASDILIQCLEAEGVRFVFGIPGEETLDLNESLDRSSIEFVPVRHEQAGAFIADVCGRLTGRAGVCLGTLGPGATNLVTGVADAYLDRAPLVALTGQVDLERMHKESHQHLDVLEIMRPITKWNARVSDPGHHPGGGAQGVQGRGGREAGGDPSRAARGRDALRVRRPPVAGEPDGAAGARRRRRAARRAGHPPRTSADRARRERCRAPARERRAPQVRAAPPASAWPRRSWARVWSAPTTPSRSGRWDSKPATTRWPASTRPIW